MQKLGQIQLQKTVTVKVQCNLNDEIVVKNFKIIMDCLKDLNQNQSDMLSKFNQLSERVSAVENNSQNNFNNVKQSNQKSAQPQSSTAHDEDLLKLIKKLDNRTSQNQKNILDNIKDINLINKQISDLKDLISKLSSKNSNNVTDSNTKENSVVGFDSINNINKEMQNNKQFIMKTNEDLDKLRKQLANMKDNFNKLIQGHTKHLSDIDSTLAKIGTGNANGNAGGSQELNKAQLNELRQKIAILNKKTNGLQMKTDQLKNQTSSLTEGQQGLNNRCQDLKKDIDNLKQLLKNMNSNSNSKTGAGDNKNKAELDELRQIKNQLKQLRIEVDELKRENNNHSKTSIEDERRRGSLTQGGRFKDDLNLKDLISRVQYLQKVIGGSKNSLDDKNDKLPLIKRPRAKESTHDKSSSKKEIADIKAEIQAWFNNYLAQNKNRDNFEQLELKIQQIRNNLNRKADNEGMKKGLTFLENKINQLYLFLTQPDGEDAMIVRKGFNCLSCSKKVEKLRGKIGPHVNWNNMTATNYSPPKVGYSRHMGEGSAQKDDNQQQ